MLLNQSTGPERPGGRLSFGDFTLDRRRGLLVREGREVALRPQSFEVLCYLVDRAGRLVTRDELMQAVWPDVVVTPDSLSQCLIDIRKALGDGSRTMICTVPRRGYRFELPVEAENGGSARPRRVPLGAAIMAALVLAAAAAFTGWWSAPDRPALAPRVAETSPELKARALDHYQRGRFFHGRREPGDLDRAIGMFRRAVIDDPGLADAWVGLAGSIYVKGFNEGTPLEGVVAEHRAYLERALDIDPLHPEGNARMARYLLATGHGALAQAHFERALESGGEDPTVLAVAAGEYFGLGRYARAMQLQRRALQMDPLHAVNHANLALMLMAAGRPAEARDILLIALDLSPGSRDVMVLHLAQAELLLREPGQALERIRELPDSLGREQVAAMASLALGRETDAGPVIRRLAESPDREAAIALAEIHAFGGRDDLAFAWLTEAGDRLFATGDEWRARSEYRMTRNSPFLEPLRDDPRWQAWLDETEARFSRAIPISLVQNP